MVNATLFRNLICGYLDAKVITAEHYLSEVTFSDGERRVILPSSERYTDRITVEIDKYAILSTSLISNSKRQSIYLSPKGELVVDDTKTPSTKIIKEGLYKLGDPNYIYLSDLDDSNLEAKLSGAPNLETNIFGTSESVSFFVPTGAKIYKNFEYKFNSNTAYFKTPNKYLLGFFRDIRLLKELGLSPNSNIFSKSYYSFYDHYNLIRIYKLGNTL